jgi:hypothetical protein
MRGRFRRRSASLSIRIVPCRSNVRSATDLEYSLAFQEVCEVLDLITQACVGIGEEFGAVKKRSVGKLTRKSVMSQGK